MTINTRSGLSAKTVLLSCFLILALLPFVTGGCSSEPVNAEGFTPAPDDTGYELLWKEVNQFNSKGLPKSALKTVEKIYDLAKSQNNAGQLVKALIHKMHYLQRVEEETLVIVFKEMNNEIKGSRFPVTPLLHSMLAQQYWNYYVNNRWRILNRTDVAADFKQDDVRTWTLRKIVEATVHHYEKSLENPEKLQKTPVNVFDTVLNVVKSGRRFRPTLYDFLAHRAIDFYMGSESGLPTPRYRFTLNNKDYFLPAEEFAKLKLSTKDTLSFRFRALEHLQGLIRYHLDDKTPDALVEADLKRLHFVNQFAVIPNKDSIYEETLKHMIEKYKSSHSAAEVYHDLAGLYNTMGGKYKPGVSEKYKWYIKKAHDLCREAIEKYPGSLGARRCKRLTESIEERVMKMELDKAVPSERPFKMLLDYKNVKTIYYRVIETSREEIEETRRKRQWDMLTHFLDKPTVKSWQVSLPDDGDYQKHAAEIKIDPLPRGVYAIFASNSGNFDFGKYGLAYNFFTVTDIAYINRTNFNEELEIYLMHRHTGQALPHASVQVWNRRYDRPQRRYIKEKGPLVRVGADGYAKLNKDVVSANYFFLEFINGDDSLMPQRNFYLSHPFKRYLPHPTTFFFTDRSIYRPGQTVYFKGIMLMNSHLEGEKNHILKNHPTRVTLFDVNNQKVNEMDLTTNEYGTFSGSFQLPTGVLTGQMRIQAKNGIATFSVEEYKRPKFKVAFKPLEKTYRLKDKVTVKGEAKAYAGYAIDNAEVKYRVVRRAFYPTPWYYYHFYRIFPPESPQMEILNGVATTDASGSFKVTFDAIPDLMLNKATRPAFRYTVYASVTDINGETRSSQKEINIGYTALKIGISLPAEVDKDTKKYSAPITSTNLSGEFARAEGTVSVFILKDPDRVFRSRNWAVPDTFSIKKDEYYRLFPRDAYKDEGNFYRWEKGKQVFHAPFDTGEDKEVTLSGIDRWKTGKYMVEMVSKDRFGSEVKNQTYFTLYSGTSRQMPYKMMDWHTVVKGSAEPGEKAVILVGSSERNLRLLYQVEHRYKIVESRFLTLSNRQQRIEIPIRDEHRGNLAVHLTFIRNNRMVSHSTNISVPWSNKKLDLSFETFRNKLVPGEKEEWRIKINGPGGDKAAAEMVATLYDASLDAFRPHAWGFNVFPSYYAIRNWRDNPYFSISTSRRAGVWRDHSTGVFQAYDTLNWFGYYVWAGDIGIRTKKRAGFRADGAPPAPTSRPARQEISRMMQIESPVEISESEEDLAFGFDGANEQKKNGGQSFADASADASAQQPVKVRTNFNETAFFYPHLKTDPDGNIVVAFTVPEALTRWKMLGFAHTKNLQYGMLTNELVTQKDLMVVPNTPRFFREGDTLVYTSKVTNLSDKVLNGNARLQLFDAVTMKPVDDVFKNTKPQQPFVAKKGQSALVKWTIRIPDSANIDAVTYRLTARAGNFTDGEEQAVPVLKNRMLVTESMPLPVRAKQTKSFVFKKLVGSDTSGSLKHHRLTLEFTSNPVWYAVQALPFLIEYPWECLEQTFSRYYANSMASYIANANPAIKRVFDVWKSQQGKKGSANANALLSNLEKNQELKSVLLQETPWVMAGKSESERKKRIALLFDLNKMASDMERALRKLEDGQAPSGGWPWFKGMKENRYITQHIITGMAHLERLKVVKPRQNNRLWRMIKKAVLYLDSKVTEDYKWLLKHEVNLKKNNLRYVHVHYFYARSYFTDIPLDDRDIKAFEYYKSQVKTYWTDYHYNKYIQGMMALVMKRYQEKDTAVAIVKSIKEHALYSEEMGMYWKQSYGYFWYQAPIETHSLLIEVFHEVMDDAKSVDELKTWLLKQKQVQDWGTTKATANACYALLLRGEDWLKENRPPEITIGKSDPFTIVPGQTGAGQDKEIIRTEAGTGYFKTSWVAPEIKPDMGNVKVVNNNDVVAWGSLYWQYFETLDKITPAKTPLSLVKKLLVEKPSDTGPVLHPIKPGTKLRIGDRIKVRIELRVDRAMEFVHMKDMRASGFEPEDVISRYHWQDGLGYYQATKDASTNFFIDRLPKGTFVFEYALRVTHEGDFSNGITSIQCMYAPEFTSHSEGIRVSI